MNVNNNEALSRQEMVDGKEKFRIDGSEEIMTDEDVDNFIDFADINKDGVISLEEFIDGATEYERMSAEEQLKDAFNLFDNNNDGFIEAPGLLDALSFLPNFEIEKAQVIIDEYDVNKDGKMDFDEFKQFILKNDQFQ